MPRYAAVDIGSNSVRMMAADVTGTGTEILAEDRQVTRLGDSVFRSGRISRDALDFLCVVLTRMADAYRSLDVIGVRAVATSAVRDASNRQQFLTRTAAALGTNVEIISGAEEARLIHLGVNARWPRPKDERFLIVDIGGGSGELIVSEGGEMVDATSKPLGAVRLTEVFLKTDPPQPEELHRMEAYIEEKLSSFYGRHGAEHFSRTIATSATAAAIVSAANRVPRAKRDEADRMRAGVNQIRQLYSLLIETDLTRRRKIPGIGPRRAEIIIAGVAAFLRALELFHQRALYYCAAGVRDGIIADLAARGVGRELSQLSREQRAVVEGMAKRYGVALKHAKHVAFLGHRLFELLRPLHQLAPAAGKLLEAASYLHDIGHFVSDTGHHKHSAYLVANSGMPGFTNRERLIIATLCRFHRKSVPDPAHPQLQNLDADSKRTVANLVPLLRIADSLDRGHEQKVRDISIGSRNGAVNVLVQDEGDADLEIWAANETAKAFASVYPAQISIRRRRLQKSRAAEA
ncbi:MAG: Ppx/GppA family phosphatase [Acidobacteriaceae bacterium]|nr:Ppx/GppA family phosphatase [Acidobacteriaceae bacterium]MBV9779423.1 Ppx/GppA family phosphatase [Acidobacteriaceae bacterium]